MVCLVLNTAMLKCLLCILHSKYYCIEINACIVNSAIYIAEYIVYEIIYSVKMLFYFHLLLVLSFVSYYVSFKFDLQCIRITVIYKLLIFLDKWWWRFLWIQAVVANTYIERKHNFIYFEVLHGLFPSSGYEMQVIYNWLPVSSFLSLNKISLCVPVSYFFCFFKNAFHL